MGVSAPWDKLGLGLMEGIWGVVVIGVGAFVMLIFSLGSDSEIVEGEEEVSVAASAGGVAFGFEEPDNFSSRRRRI